MLPLLLTLLAPPLDPAVAGFESAAAWRTEADLLDTFGADQLWCSRDVGYEALASGLTLSEEPVTEGRFSGRWADHPRFPTLHTTQVPNDWRGAGSLAVQIHSEVATGEVITVAVLTDNPGTAWRDWRRTEFAVDWTGWREVNLPLREFAPMGSPLGWEAVGGIWFFTKIDDRQPHPGTVLHLDELQLRDEAGERTVGRVEAAPTAAGRLKITAQIPFADLSRLNHDGPELRAPAVAPIQQESYFKAARALFGYDPKFVPGAVSFAPDGTPYLVYGSYLIQTLGDDGKWVARNLLDDVIEPYARETLGFRELELGNLGQTNDASLRFDSDGDAYLLVFVSDPTGNWRSRTGLLLHSRDELKSWTVYRLPYYTARFEKQVGHNTDGLAHPPVLLLSRYLSPTTNYLIVPEKRADGTLALPEPVTLVPERAVGFSPHSGEANNVITQGDLLYVVYGRLDVLPGKTKEDGVPNYIVTFNRRTGERSEPVLLGFGGKNAEDDHNWPTLAVDGAGYLHVIINGHHDPFVYVRSLRPWDISEWTAPEKVAEGTTYAGLVIDQAGTLYSVTRHAEPGYYFRLSLHRKVAGQGWEEPRHLVRPYKPYYKIWYHKLTIQPGTDKLFLAYYGQSASICVFRDEFLAYRDIWPHREQEMLSSVDGPRVPVGTALIEPRKYEFYGVPATEPTILVSDDRGESWRVAETGDFR